jgi:hypothetical protein
MKKGDPSKTHKYKEVDKIEKEEVKKQGVIESITDILRRELTVTCNYFKI